jgi:hypothetical protein
MLASSRKLRSSFDELILPFRGDPTLEVIPQLGYFVPNIQHGLGIPSEKEKNILE